MRNLYYFFIGLGLILSSEISLAQKNDENKNLFLDAEYFLVSEDYQDALTAYLTLISENPKNANLNYRIGLCLLNINGQKSRATEYLKKSCNNISDKYLESSYNETYAPPEALFLLGTAYQIINELDLAEAAFEEYKNYLDVKDVYEIDFVNKQIKSCATARKYMAEPVKIQSRNLEGIIPQYEATFNPVLSTEQNMFIYMTKEKFYDAIWMVRKQKDSWSNPVNITPQLMSDGDCYPTSITGNGEVLYLVRMTNYGSNIYVSNFEGSVWSPIKKLNKPINSKYFETHAGISSDGNTLYLSSNKKGGFGGQDIYTSKKNEQGKWEEPKNLGGSINTPYNEGTPFILPDGMNLYFSSQGHEGMGGFDTYKSVNQGGNRWSVPQNLGYPWNTTDDNTFLYPIENGEKALYSGIIDNKEQQSSIKELSLLITKSIYDLKVNLIGSIHFQDNNKADNSLKIEVREKEGGIITENIHLNSNTGEFSLVVSPGIYSLTAIADKYEDKTVTVEIRKDYNRSDFPVNFELIPEEIASGEYIIIKNVLFDFNSYELDRIAQMEIERLYSIMIQYPELYIEVAGHTDSKGNADYNFELSSKRAQAVIQYLVSNGIDPIRFISKATGELESIAFNQNPDGSDNPEGRKHNRNASIKILKSSNSNIVVEPIPVPDYLKPKNIPVYTVMLVRSDKSLDNSYFKDINNVVSNGVNEMFHNSIYIYTIGRFYSIIQAEEVLHSRFFSKFKDAKIINVENQESYTSHTSLISESSSEKYGIQIIAYRNPVNSRRFEHLSDYRISKCNDGFYRVIYGDYKTKSEAREELNYIKGRGYEDAFIVDFSLIESISNDNTILSSENITYTIQLKALRTRLGDNYFSGIKNVRIIEDVNGIIRYIYGEYSNLSRASEELLRIKKLGYNDAFIRDVNSIPGHK